jgi:RecA-family ATPase
VNAAPQDELVKAFAYAAAGYPVLPGDKNKKPLVPIEQASTEPHIIDAWWKQFPDAIAMITRRKTLATPFEWIEPAKIPRRDCLYGGHYYRQFGSATIAASGVGKSSLVLVEAVVMASGKPLLGLAPKHRCRVWYWNGEDPKDELDRRVAAICKHYRLNKDDLEGWLFLDNRDREIIITTRTRDGVQIAQPVVSELINTIEHCKLDVVMIDPFVASHRVTENANDEIERVAKQWTWIAQQTDSSVDMVHHPRKTGGQEVTVEDGRGASALLAAVRSARVLNVMTKGEATKAGVSPHRA